MTQTQIKNRLYEIYNALSSTNLVVINNALRSLQKLEEQKDVCIHTPYYLIDIIDDTLSRCLYMLDINDKVRLNKNIKILKRKLKEQINLV